MGTCLCWPPLQARRGSIERGVDGGDQRVIGGLTTEMCGDRLQEMIALSDRQREMPTIPRLLEAAWAHASPGREVAERSAVLRELSQLQQQPRGAGAMLYRRERIHPTGCVGRDGAQ
jgi:hypothetical protein